MLYFDISIETKKSQERDSENTPTPNYIYFLPSVHLRQKYIKCINIFIFEANECLKLQK